MVTLLDMPDPELLEAWRRLFGDAAPFTRSLLAKLGPAGLKSEFKRRALDSHPDRARVLGRPEEALDREFRSLMRSYEILLGCIRWQDGAAVGSVPMPREPRARHGAPAEGTPRFRGAALPPWHLRIGQMLYHGGAITMGALVEAVLWQRDQRPKVGALAVELGILDPQDVARILGSRGWNEKFCDCALRIGRLGPDARFLLLERQKGLQRRIGEFFVERGLLTRGDIALAVEEQRLHNRKVASGGLRGAMAP